MKKFREFINKYSKTVGIIGIAIIVACTAYITLSFTGCQYYTDSTGQDTVKLTDEVTGVLDKAVEIAPVVQDALVGASIAFPALAGVFGIVAGAVGAFSGAYKKYRPQITRERDKAVQAGNVTEALVYALERFKASNPNDWGKASGYLKEELLDKIGPEALTIIEAIVQSYHKEE